MQKQTSSLKTLDAGDDQYDLNNTLHNVLMSDELVDDLDPDDLYGEGGGEGETRAGDETTTPEATRRLRSVRGFTCKVTMDDERDVTGAVVSFERGRTSRIVRMLLSMRDADDVCSREITNITVMTPSGVGVFDCTFDEDDPLDAPHIAADIGNGVVAITLAFEVAVQDDSYKEEVTDDDDTQE